MSNPFLNPYSPLYRPPERVELLPGRFVDRSIENAVKMIRRCAYLLMFLKAGPATRAAIVEKVGYKELAIERAFFNVLVYMFKFSVNEWKEIADKAGWTAEALDVLTLNDWLTVQSSLDVSGKVTIDPGIGFSGDQWV